MSHDVLRSWQFLAPGLKGDARKLLDIERVSRCCRYDGAWLCERTTLKRQRRANSALCQPLQAWCRFLYVAIPLHHFIPCSLPHE